MLNTIFRVEIQIYRTDASRGPDQQRQAPWKGGKNGGYHRFTQVSYRHSRNQCWEWLFVENCLKEYIDECAEITETSDIVYIGTDFPDEFVHSKDTKELRGQIFMRRQIP